MQKRDITPSRNVNHRTGRLMADGDRYVSVCSDEQLVIAQHLIKTDEVSEVLLILETKNVCKHFVALFFCQFSVQNSAMRKIIVQCKLQPA